MTAVEIVAELNRRGVSLIVRDGRIIARPSGAVPSEIKAAAQRCKAELIALLADHAAGAAEEALTLLARLKGYTLPEGRMPVACELATCLRSLDETLAILGVLQDFEQELIARGGRYDRELAGAVAIVERGFPGALLV